MDDDKEIDEEVEEGEEDEVLGGEKKPKVPKDEELSEDSLDSLAEEETETLPEDNYDDVDLW